MPGLTFVISAISVVVLLALAVAPLGLAEWLRLVQPGLPVLALHFWTRPEAGSGTAWIAFLAGLLVDVAGGGPLGYWPPVYLTGVGAATLLENHLQPAKSGTRRLASFVVSAAALWLVAWASASLYAFTLQSWHPFATAWCALVLLYPFIAATLSPLERLADGARRLSFERGE